MDKQEFIIDRCALKKLGIDPNEVIAYLENKKADTIRPIHVKALNFWKDVVHSS